MGSKEFEEGSKQMVSTRNMASEKMSDAEKMGFVMSFKGKWRK